MSNTENQIEKILIFYLFYFIMFFIKISVTIFIIKTSTFIMFISVEYQLTATTIASGQQAPVHGHLVKVVINITITQHDSLTRRLQWLTLTSHKLNPRLLVSLVKSTLMATKYHSVMLITISTYLETSVNLNTPFDQLHH